MPWQPFTPDSVGRKTVREDSPDSLASRSERFRRRPSYLEEFDIQVGLFKGDISDLIWNFHFFSLSTEQRRMDTLSLQKNTTEDLRTPRSGE